MGRAIDQLVGGRLAALLRLVLLMLGVYVLSAAAQLVQGVVIAGIAQKAMRALRADLFSHIQTLSLRFFDSRSQGDLMSRLTNDMDVISQVLTNNAAQLFTGILTIAGILAIIFVLSPWLALGSMIAFPLMIGLVGMVGRKTRTAFRSYQAGLGALNAVLEETYSGQRVVLAFGQEEKVLSRFDAANEAVRAVGVRAMSLAFLVMPMMGILSNLNVAILCGLGGWLADAGDGDDRNDCGFHHLLAALCRAAAPVGQLVQPGAECAGRRRTDLRTSGYRSRPDRFPTGDRAAQGGRRSEARTRHLLLCARGSRAEGCLAPCPARRAGRPRRPHRRGENDAGQFALPLL